MIHAYCGDGKGKSTAAIGLLVRAVGQGMKGHLIMFDKGSETYRHHEIEPLRQLGVQVEVTGCERMTQDRGFRLKNTDDDLAEARRGYHLAEQAFGSATVEILVLDEILSAVTYGLLPEADLLSLLGKAPVGMEIVLTGRCENERILSQADLVTSMNKVRHYFDRGIPSRPGIEY